MSDVTITQFAEVLKVPVDRLLSQLEEAGIENGGPDATISDDAKMELLTYLRRSHGRQGAATKATPGKITLQRRSQSELRLSGTQGRSRTVNVEVRKKRTLSSAAVQALGSFASDSGDADIQEIFDKINARRNE